MEFLLNSPFPGQVLPALASPSSAFPVLTQKSLGQTLEPRYHHRPPPRRRHQSTIREARGLWVRPPLRHSDGTAL